MDISTPASLDLACPQAKADIKKYVHMFRDRGVDKNKIRRLRASRSFLEQHIYIYTYIYCYMISYAKVTIRSQSQV